MIYDCFLFHNELDLLEIRLNVLDDVVDKFVLVEATETFSGLPKPLFYQDNKERFAKFNHKIIHHVVDGYTPEEWAEAKASPNTGGLDHWCREFVQRENLKKPLEGCNDDDIIFISDVDEVWHPGILMGSGFVRDFRDSTIMDGYKPAVHLSYNVYSYWLNNKSSESFVGGFFAKYGDVNNSSLNVIRRTPPSPFPIHAGWHFTSIGGAEALKKKIESYGHQEFNTAQVKDNISRALETNTDYIGRNFTYTIDESQWPQYLKDNKEKYAHLCKM